MAIGDRSAFIKEKFSQRKVNYYSVLMLLWVVIFGVRGCRFLQTFQLPLTQISSQTANCVAVLCGQLLCFFRDHDDFLASKAATSPIIVFKARCEKAEDYTKRKHVFRFELFNFPPCLPK
jgi:hypothetical protein